MINPAAWAVNTRDINDYLYEDGERINDRSTYNSTASYDNTTTQSLRITYNNTDDIAEHYVHTAFADYFDCTAATCPDYDVNIPQDLFFRIPVFTLYWNIRSYGKLILIRNTIQYISFSVCIKSTITVVPPPPPPPPKCLVYYSENAVMNIYLGLTQPNRYYHIVH